jgi:hypothetical protein
MTSRNDSASGADLGRWQSTLINIRGRKLRRFPASQEAAAWVLDGHHLGYGLLRELGDPSGAPLQLMGMTHYHWKDGKIVDEWNVYDELALLTQVKLHALQNGAIE